MTRAALSIAILLLAPLAGARADWTIGVTGDRITVAGNDIQGAGRPEEFVITFSAPPANITLGTTFVYAGPADPAKALYDSGDGVWRSYTGNIIPVVGEYVAFKGDWRTASGTYQNMFNETFLNTPYSCSFSGSFEHAATADNAYRAMFRYCNKVVAIHDNPLPPIIGTPATGMFQAAYENMTGVTSLPDGFMNTSGLTGSPAPYMFQYACSGMSGVTGSLPDGFMDTSGLTGSPAANMFYYACYNMSGVTGSLPDGFMNTSGLTGSPATYLFYNACRNMSGVTGSLPDGFMDTSGLTGSPAANMFYYACYNMSGVTGSLPDGFMDTSGLTGSPAANMFDRACQNMSGVTNSYVFNISSNVTLTANNVNGSFNYAFYGMSKWTGTVMWGTNVLFETITPAVRTYTIQNCTQIPGYAGFDANWK